MCILGHIFKKRREWLEKSSIGCDVKGVENRGQLHVERERKWLKWVMKNPAIV